MHKYGSYIRSFGDTKINQDSRYIRWEYNQAKKIIEVTDRCFAMEGNPCPFGCQKAIGVPNCEYNILQNRCTR